MRGCAAATVPRRLVKIRELADRMGFKHPNAHYRAQYVRRLIQRLERRDGCRYMRQVGTGRGAHWYVSPAALEAIEPYSATALGKLRQDVDDTREDVREIRRNLNAHGGRIRELEKFRKAADAYIRILAE